MAENPLLPNAELLSLLSLLSKACQKPEAGTVSRAAARSIVGQEALLSATLMQLRSADALVLLAGPLQWASALLRTRPKARIPELTQVSAAPSASALLTAVGVAAAMARTPLSEAVTFATLLSGAPDPAWQDALHWAVTDSLPLVLAVADFSGNRAFQPTECDTAGTLHWAAVRKLAVQAQLPILTVDGDDAVAVYRTVQESLLRARARGGPALLWCVLPTAPRKPSQNPASLDRLVRYVVVRKLLPRQRQRAS